MNKNIDKSQGVVCVSFFKTPLNCLALPGKARSCSRNTVLINSFAQDDLVQRCPRP